MCKDILSLTASKLRQTRSFFLLLSQILISDIVFYHCLLFVSGNSWFLLLIYFLCELHPLYVFS